MSLVLHFAARSDVGRVRSKNDDSAYAGRHLAVVADGMGGHVGGDVASASTVLDLAPLDATGYPDPSTVLPDEIQNANLILNDLVHANPKLAGMGTTCTAVLLAGTTLHLAHIGDSRAYRLREDEFSQVTKDHTFVQRLVDEGRLHPDDAESHPHKNVLMRVLGDVDASPELDITALEVTAGERWLLCSDGLTAVVPPTVIESKLRHGGDLRDVVDELVELTLAGGAPDNVTIVALEIVQSDEQDPPETEPSSEALSDEALAAATPARTGPVSATLLREDLQSRPHELVGAADLATQTGKIPIVTRRSTEKRAAALLTGGSPTRITGSGGPAGLPAPAAAATGAAAGVSTPAGQAQKQAADPESPHSASPAGAQDLTAQADLDAERRGIPPEDLTGAIPPRRRRSVFLPVFTALLALTFLAVLTFGYLWTQTQYYVGNNRGQVAIFNGVSQQVGPISLSHLDHETDIPLDRLPAYSRQRLLSGLPARDLEHAQEIVAELEGSLTPEAPPVSDPSTQPSPSPSATAAPSPSPSGSAQSPSPSGTRPPVAEVNAVVDGAAAGALGGRR